MIVRLRKRALGPVCISKVRMIRLYAHGTLYATQRPYWDLRIHKEVLIKGAHVQLRSVLIKCD